MSGKKPSLGRGLAELSPLLAQRARAPLPEPPPLAGDRLANLPLDLLQRGKYQPRVDMRPETLSELADSIKSQGLVQPILVRPLPHRNPGGFAAKQSKPGLQFEQRRRNSFKCAAPPEHRDAVVEPPFIFGKLPHKP